MRRRILAIICLCLTTAGVFQSVNAAEYTIVNVSNNESRSHSVSLNNNGDMAWTEVVDTPTPWGWPVSTEIYLYKDGIVSQFTSNDWDDSGPILNDAGQILWSTEPVDYYEGGSTEIAFYDGVNVRQLTSDGDADIHRTLNDSGQILWVKNYRHQPYYRWVYFFDGTNTRVLDEGPQYRQQTRLDDSGRAVWTIRVNGNDRIHYFDGASISPLTPGTTYQSSVNMNEQGQVVWGESDGNDYEVFMWDNGVTSQITNNDYDDIAPRLNDQGQIAWTAYLGDAWYSSEVFFFDGLTTKQITQNGQRDFAEALNNNGHIVIERLVDSTDFNSRELFVFDGAEEIQLTNDRRRPFNVQINDRNQIAWVANGDLPDLSGFSIPTLDVFLANRVEPIEIRIDIKPGSDPNCFNNNGIGVIPVAVLGSGTFDIAQIDIETVRFESMQVKVAGKSNKLLASVEDTNNDDFMDLIVKIQDEDGIFGIGEVDAKLTGNLLPEFNTLPFEGTDSICVVP